MLKNVIIFLTLIAPCSSYAVTVNSSWETGIKTDAMTGMKTGYTVTKSIKGTDQFGQPYMFGVVCDNDKLSSSGVGTRIRMGWDQFINSETDIEGNIQSALVTYRFDDGPVKTKYFTIGYKGVFTVLYGHDAVAFIKQMEKHSTLRLRTVDYEGDLTNVAIFSLKGFGKNLGQVCR